VAGRAGSQLSFGEADGFRERVAEQVSGSGVQAVAWEACCLHSAWAV